MSYPETFYISFKQIDPPPLVQYQGDAGDATPELLEKLLVLAEGADSYSAFLDYLTYEQDCWPEGYPEYRICMEDVTWIDWLEDAIFITEQIPGVVMRVQVEGPSIDDYYLVYAYNGKSIGTAPELVWPVYSLKNEFGISEYALGVFR